MNITTQEEDFPLHILILKEELARRILRNPEYSLRAFAKGLNLDPSLLSKLLKNTRKISPNTAVKIIEKINLSPGEKRVFWDSYIKEREDSYKEREKIPTTLNEQYLDHDLFKVISEPYHYAIVEIYRIKKYRGNIGLIANTLGLKVTTVEAAIKKLISIGMLEIRNGEIQRSDGRFTTKDKEITDTALKYHQKKILQKAMLALDEVAIEHRIQNSMTIAINPKKIPLLKKMFQDFINQASDVLETGEVKEVYQMSLSLFPFYNLEQNTTSKDISYENHQ